MAGSDLTSWAALLKEDYAPAVVNQLAEETNALDFMEKEVADDDWTGNEKVQPIQIGRNWSTGSIGAGGALPQAGKSVYKEFKIPMRDTYGRVGFERMVIEQSRNKKGSWLKVVPTEMENLTESIAFARNRIAWGYGSGILCLVNGAVSAGGTTITVDAPGNVAGSILGNRYIQGDAISGPLLAFLNSSTLAVEHTGTVTSVSAAGLTFVIDTPAPVGGISDNALVVFAQSATQNSYNKEPEGILAGCDDGTYVGTYHDLSRTTYPILKSYVTTAVGALSLDAMQTYLDALQIKVGRKGGKAVVDFFACEPAVRRAYLALLETDRRYTGANLMSPDGGTRAAKKPSGSAITYGDIPIMEDRDAPFGMLFGLNKESWIRYILQEGQFADDDGSTLKWVSGFDQYTAYFYILDNWHCQQPNKNFRAEGITVNQIVVRSF